MDDCFVSLWSFLIYDSRIVLLVLSLPSILVLLFVLLSCLRLFLRSVIHATAAFDFRPCGESLRLQRDCL